MLLSLTKRSLWHLGLPTLIFSALGLAISLVFPVDSFGRFICVLMIVLNLSNFKINHPISSFVVGIVNVFFIVYLSNNVLNILSTIDKALNRNYIIMFAIVGLAEVLLLMHLSVYPKYRKWQFSVK
jgi:hypothetical protein